MAEESYTGEAYGVKCKAKREFTGHVVANPSVSTSPGAVYLQPRLARRQPQG